MKHGCNIIGGDGGGCCEAHDHAYQEGYFLTKIGADFKLFGCLTSYNWLLTPLWLIVLVLCLTFGSVYWLKYLARRLLGWFPKETAK